MMACVFKHNNNAIKGIATITMGKINNMLSSPQHSHYWTTTHHKKVKPGY
jgi:hypothetical protein